MDFAIYYNKENLENICTLQNILFKDDIASALTQECKSNFLFSKEEILASPYLDAFFKKYVPYWKADFRNFVPEEKKEDFDNDFSVSKFFFDKAFLLCEIESKRLREEKGLIYASTNEEELFFNYFFFNKSKKDFSKDFTIGHDFKTWEDILPFALPITELIFIDQFMLQMNGSLPQLDNNLLSCMASLISQTNSIVNVVLYTRKDTINIAGWNDRIDKLAKRIKDRIKEQTAKNINVTLILLGGANLALLRKMKEHDRTIITNYHRIILGPSLNFIGNDQVLNASARHIEIKSLLREETRENVKILIKDLQEYINISKEFATITIEGDRKSNYLTFP